MNGQPAVTTLISDGDVHRRRRSVLMRPMMPSALADVRDRIDHLADELIDEEEWQRWIAVRRVSAMRRRFRDETKTD